MTTAMWRLKHQDKRLRRADVLLIGVGNEYRDDDALGILIAREFRRRKIHGLHVVEASGEGASLIEALKLCHRAFIVDAMLGPTPGWIHRIDAVHSNVPTGVLPHSTHAFGVAEALAMARELHQLPDTVVLFGIEGAEFGTGVGLSDPVVKSIPALIAMIEDELAHPVPREPLPDLSHKPHP